mmetsp:Transcript_35361/g.114009  ORF Transcript_35361/g.114009 Transcript_35361/m.114009 type:complete len:281 (+) Transcript_35361:318-1160(+)
MSEQDVSHIRISSDGPPSLAASLLMTVGQLPCGVCPTTSRWMPLAARDWTREGGGGSGMPLLRRCRPSTTDGVPASKGLSLGGLRGRPTGGRTVRKRGRLLASISRVSSPLRSWLTSAPLSSRTDDIGGMTCSCASPSAAATTLPPPSGSSSSKTRIGPAPKVKVAAARAGAAPSRPARPPPAAASPSSPGPSASLSRPHPLSRVLSRPHRRTCARPPPLGTPGSPAGEAPSSPVSSPVSSSSSSSASRSRPPPPRAPARTPLPSPPASREATPVALGTE